MPQSSSSDFFNSESVSLQKQASHNKFNRGEIKMTEEWRQLSSDEQRRMEEYEAFRDIERRLEAKSPAVASYRSRRRSNIAKAQDEERRRKEKVAFEAANIKKIKFAAKMKKEGEERSRLKALMSLPKYAW